MLRCDHQERGAVERVWACGVDMDFFIGQTIDIECDFSTLGAADPGSLLALGGVGPIELVKTLEKLIGIGSNAEDPLVEIPAFDGVAADLGFALNDLLVGEYSTEFWAPPDGALINVGEAMFKEL